MTQPISTVHGEQDLFCESKTELPPAAVKMARLVWFECTGNCRRPITKQGLGGGRLRFLARPAVGRNRRVRVKRSVWWVE